VCVCVCVCVCAYCAQLSPSTRACGASNEITGRNITINLIISGLSRRLIGDHLSKMYENFSTVDYLLKFISK